MSVLVAATAVVPAAAAPQSAVGSLDMRATFGLVSNLAPCPSGVPPGTTDCRARTGNGSASGLGRVTETYTWHLAQGPPACPPELSKPLATTGRLVVAGKGDITFALAAGAQCVGLEPVRNEPQALTITGGTGLFAGASGSGKLEARAIGGDVGTETWTGTLDVPGLEFDLAPPTISGATSKTVRVPKKAKNARVTFKVTATDAVDGAVPVACQPRSGSRFKVGKTTVRCEATDSSANTAKAAFTVTVKRRLTLSTRAISSSTATLALDAVLQVESRRFVACPPNTGSTIECVTRNGQGKVPGLGAVTVATYMYFIDLVPTECPLSETRVLSSSLTLAVAGKGEITVATAPTGCLQGQEGRPNTVQSFSITGGTGMYAGATGGGTLSRAFTVTDVGAIGPETWTGTLTVPGLEFDVTPPTLGGATSKTVRVPKKAKNARVTFKVTATDAVDGAVPVACQPRSGSRFKVGKTTVRCEATDSSANTANAAFTVTVRRR